jgi:nucleoside 2-deoxyribosyltransferase
MKKSPVCFVAMAFGWEDTDAFYEKQILPTLKRNGIKPIIINRHQSNDDLNFQIFEQLDKADFCIADLTYTRPSVYFEAGYAQRAIPVIYTVRKDHFGKGQPEDLRVHFDLQMKPIIDWKDASDTTFSNRLEKRIKVTFLKEWNKRQESNLESEKDEKEFKNLPGFARLSGVRYQTILALKKSGYQEANWAVNPRFDHISYNEDSIRKGSVNYVYAYKVNKNNLSVVAVQSFSSPSKKELMKLEENYTFWISLPRPILDLLKKLKNNKVQVNIITLSLNPLAASRIESVLPDLLPIENSKIYSEKLEYDSIKVYSKFYFVSGIKSFRSLRGKLDEIVLDMKNN